MKYTSTEAAKLLRKLNNEISTLTSLEYLSKEYVATLGEDIESIKPEYDYEATQGKLIELDAQVRKVKHTINEFNLTHIVPGTDMTIDQLLVYIPQLGTRIRKLEQMSDRLQKVRHQSGYGGANMMIEYNYANYEVAQAAKDCAEAKDELARLQTALDLLNSTETMEIEL